MTHELLIEMNGRLCVTPLGHLLTASDAVVRWPSTPGADLGRKVISSVAAVARECGFSSADGLEKILLTQGPAGESFSLVSKALAFLNVDDWNTPIVRTAFYQERGA